MHMHGGLLCITFCISVCLSVCNVTKIHTSGTALPKVPKFGQSMAMDDLEVDPGGQGHRSPAQENVISLVEN